MDGSRRSRGVTRVRGEARERPGGVRAPAVGRWGAERPLKAWAPVGAAATAAGRRARQPRRRGFGQQVEEGSGEALAARRGAEQQRADARRRVVRRASPRAARIARLRFSALSAKSADFSDSSPAPAAQSVGRPRRVGGGARSLCSNASEF
jgi:hypothetical protein